VPRPLRPNTPVIYDADEEFEIGGSRTLREGDDVSSAAARITVPEALHASEPLPPEGVEARVLDLYDMRHWSERTVIALVMQSRDNSITVFTRPGRLGRRVLTSRPGPGAPNLSERAGQPGVRLQQGTAVTEMPMEDTLFVQGGQDLVDRGAMEGGLMHDQAHEVGMLPNQSSQLFDLRPAP